MIDNRIFIPLGIALVIAVSVRANFSSDADRPAAPTKAAASAQIDVAIPAGRKKLAAGAAAISRKSDGHYWTTADVDGVAIKFMVDTGASVVALTSRDALRLGLDPDALLFDVEIRTAGGITYGAATTLANVRIGSVEVDNVKAIVLKDELDQSLLGMSFLGELKGYAFDQDQLILRQ
jgi:aspartyl protease family protein